MCSILQNVCFSCTGVKLVLLTMCCQQVACPDTYRGKYRDCDFPRDDLAHRYASDVDAVLAELHAKGKAVCCFIAESMQSCGGQIIYPQEYLRMVFKYVTFFFTLTHVVLSRYCCFPNCGHILS